MGTRLFGFPDLYMTNLKGDGPDITIALECVPVACKFNMNEIGKCMGGEAGG